MEMNNAQENTTDSLMLDRGGEQKKRNIQCERREIYLQRAAVLITNRLWRFDSEALLFKLQLDAKSGLGMWLQAPKERSSGPRE